MVLRDLKINTLRGLLIVSSLGFTACVDNDYDLSKDIDMTVTIGGENLSIPGSNTDLITMDKILDLDPGSDVKTDANGDYSLTMDGNGEPSTVNVEKVTIESDNINTTPSASSLSFEYAPDADSEADVDDMSSFDVDKNDVTEDLTGLYHATTTCSSTLNMSYSGSARRLHLARGFKVTFPEYLTVNCVNDPRFTIDGNVLTFNQDVTINSGTTLEVPLTIDAIDFTKLDEGEGLVERGHLVMTGDIPVNGRAYLKADDFLSEEDVTLEMHTDMNLGDIEFTEVTATVDPQIDITIDPVTINNLPDCLKDDDVRIDMTDPKIYFNVTNGSPVPVNFTADMLPYKEGRLLNTVAIGDKDGGTEPIIIPANVSDYTICLHRLEDGSGIEADDIITVPDLNNLVETIPDEIRTENIVVKAIQEKVTLEPGKDYGLNTDYNVSAPLQFNSGTEIIYTDSLDDWNGDLEDFDARHAEISLDAKNTIPLAMEMTADAIDVNGNVMSEITATVTGGVNAGTAENPSTSKLTIRLESKADGAMKRLDGIIYKIRATVPEDMQGKVLNENQSLQLDNVVISVKGGITIDMN